MKEVKIKNKKFKIIPEAKLIKGEMYEKGYEKDLRIGIKPIYKSIIAFAAVLDRFMRTNTDGAKLISAYAYCDEKDTWDEKRGIEVCSAKLELRNHRKLAKAYNRISRDLQEAALIAQSFCIRHEDKAQSIEDDLCRTFGRLKV